MYRALSVLLLLFLAGFLVWSAEPIAQPVTVQARPAVPLIPVPPAAVAPPAPVLAKPEQAAPPARVLGPADAVILAWADAQAQPAFVQPYTRYLSLEDLEEKDRESAWRVLSGHVNSLSRESEIVRPPLVGGMILRLNTKDYGWDVKVWEKLAEADPFFHTKLKKVETVIEPWEGGVWPGDGQSYAAGAFKVERKKAKVFTASAPWLPTKEISSLIEVTQSQVPIVRGTWFLHQTAIQAGRNPGYYDFLKVQNQKDFENLVGFDEKQSRAFSNLWREAVSRSGVIVGKRPRRLERLRSLGGGLWRSLDSKVTKDKSNPLRVLDDALEFEASEQFAPLPNGMAGWLLTNNKGVRQDTAPDAIASDQTGAANDSRIHIYLNCVKCHNQAMLKPFEPWARTLFQAPRGLESADYDKLKELRQQYLRHLEPHVTADRLGYETAIAEATGLTSTKWAKELFDLWTYYEEADVTVEWAARSLGTTVPKLQAALEQVKRATGQIDPVAATYLRPPARSIGIETFEELYPILQAYLMGYVP